MIIAGLGNPGKKYENTPHNIGFKVMDEFARKNDFPDFKFSKIFNADISKKDGVTLAKPQTFMNNSGLVIKKFLEARLLENCTQDFERSGPSRLIIVHDDIDLPLGKIKVSRNRGSAGHKGVESIIKELGTKDFTRIRIGIYPRSHTLDYGTEKYVLKKFSKEDREVLKEVFEEVSKKLLFLVI